MKPTRGLVTNAVVEVEGFASSGVVSRTLADTAAALDVLTRHDPGAWWSQPTPTRSLADALNTASPTGLRIGVLTTSLIEGITVDPACLTAVEETLRTLEEAGHQIVDKPLPLPTSEDLISTFMNVWHVASAGIPLVDPGRVEPHNRAQRDAAKSVDSWTYAESVHKTQVLSRRIVEAFTDSFDVLVTPTMACLPPKVGAWRRAEIRWQPRIRWAYSRRCST